MDIPLTMVMCLPKLKDLLITVLAFVPFWESHMSTHMTTMSEFFEAWMTRGWAAKVMSLNMSVLDRMSSTWELVMGEDTLLPKYGTPRSLRKDLDWGCHSCTRTSGSILYGLPLHQKGDVNKATW